MKRYGKYILGVMLAMLFCLGALPVGAAPSVNADDYTFRDLRNRRVAFQYLENDGYIGIPVAITTYYGGQTSHGGTEVILYLQGYVGAGEVGLESAETIVGDLVDQGDIVVVLDYLEDPRAVSPHLEWSVQAIRQNIRKYIPSKLSFASEQRFVVPDGYRLARNIKYYNYEENARKGVLDRIIDIYNTSTSFRAKSGIPNLSEKVTSIDRCLKKDGTPIDLNLRLDIIYPSAAREAAPLVAIASSAETRLSVCSTTPNRPVDVAALLRGCAVAFYDHEYTPMSRDDHYGYIAEHTLRNYVGVATHTAAIRCLRYYADTFGYDRDHIAVMGHSKSSWCGLLAHPQPETLAEMSSYAGYNGVETYGEQPFLCYEDGTPIPSNVQVSYRSMGDGVFHRSRYLNGENAPTLICCGVKDPYASWDHFYQEQKDYEKVSVDHLAIAMSDQGHTYPFGTDPEYGYDRLAACMDFLAYYLMEDLPARLVYTSAVGGRLMGDVVIVRHDKAGSKDFSHAEVKTDEQILVQFLAPVTEESAKAGITLYDTTAGRSVPVTYAEKGNGSRWYLAPTGELTRGHTYELRVAAEVTSVLSGKALGVASVSSFVY